MLNFIAYNGLQKKRNAPKYWIAINDKSKKYYICRIYNVEKKIIEGNTTPIFPNHNNYITSTVDKKL